MELTSKNFLNIVKSRGAVYETELIKTFSTSDTAEVQHLILNEAIKLIRMKLIELEFDSKGNRLYTSISRTLHW